MFLLVGMPVGTVNGDTEECLEAAGGVITTREQQTFPEITGNAENITLRRKHRGGPKISLLSSPPLSTGGKDFPFKGQVKKSNLIALAAIGPSFRAMLRPLRARTRASYCGGALAPSISLSCELWAALHACPGEAGGAAVAVLPARAARAAICARRPAGGSFRFRA